MAWKAAKIKNRPGMESMNFVMRIFVRQFRIEMAKCLYVPKTAPLKVIKSVKTTLPKLRTFKPTKEFNLVVKMYTAST